MACSAPASEFRRPAALAVDLARVATARAHGVRAAAARGLSRRPGRVRHLRERRAPRRSPPHPAGARCRRRPGVARRIAHPAPRPRDELGPGPFPDEPSRAGPVSSCRMGQAGGTACPRADACADGLRRSRRSAAPARRDRRPPPLCARGPMRGRPGTHRLRLAGGAAPGRRGAAGARRSRRRGGAGLSRRTRRIRARPGRSWCRCRWTRRA